MAVKKVMRVRGHISFIALITLEEISTQMGLSTIIQIPCHHVLANEIALNLKYRIGIKQSFNTNLGMGIIKQNDFFVRIFNISLCVFTQISIARARWKRK